MRSSWLAGFALSMWCTTTFAQVTTPNPILFVTQFPIPDDFAAIGSVFANHRGGTDLVGRGGDLYIRYGDGTFYDDDTRTGPSGEYEFRWLRAGSYTIFTYSECAEDCESGVELVSRSVEIGGNCSRSCKSTATGPRSNPRGNTRYSHFEIRARPKIYPAHRRRRKSSFIPLPTCT